MPRSSLLNALIRIAADVERARRPVRPVGWGPKIDRRVALRGAASLASTALLPRLSALAAAEARVAVVGAGLAGLTAANELSNAGLRPDVYEGSTKLGGRCLSIRSPDGQIVEQGGEFINTYGHEAIMRLAFELHLELDDTYDENTNYDELWRFDDAVYTRDQASTDWEKLQPVIEKQFDDIGGDKCCYKDSNPYACELDQMSLADWVGKYVCGGRTSKLGQLIENALSEECAADSTLLSGLVPAQQLWANTQMIFWLYDRISDERYHIRGGNDQIPCLLGKKLEKLGITVQTGTALTAITRKDGKVQLALTRDSKVFDKDYDKVILALPFTTLRQVNIANAGFRQLKCQAIEKLGMGTSTKLQLRFRDRNAWHNDNLKCEGVIRLKSDLFQSTWDVTSARRHDRGPGGMLCFWSGGRQAKQAEALDIDKLSIDCLAEAEKLLPGLTRAWTHEKPIRSAWLTNPWSSGSYAYLPIGYATTLFGVEKEPEGNCFFAGEHTADKAVDCGYLNAAVETGQRAAKEVIDSLIRSWMPE